MPDALLRQALSLFWETIRRGWFYRLWARLTRRRERLLELEETLAGAQVENSFYAGTHPVAIDRIRGTQSKGGDFDAEFHPLRESSRTRWLSIAIERLRGRDLPPVDLVEVNGVFYVRDGHHRISVARSLGQDFIDAEIVRMNLNRRIM